MILRIGIDGSFLSELATGSGQYAFHLCQALAKLDKNNDYFILKAKRASGGLQAGGLQRNWKAINPRPLPSRIPDNLAKVLWEQTRLPRFASGLNLDVLHVPYFAGPVVSPIPLVMTIHDVIPLVLPQYRGPRSAAPYWSLVCAAAKRAKCIITDSEASRWDIIHRINVIEDKVRVVYLGVDESLYGVPSEEKVNSLKTRLGVRGRFVLYVGGLDVRKNVVSLLRAFAGMTVESGELPQLVIVGRPFSGDPVVFPDLNPVIDDLGIRSRIVFTGPVSDDERILLYQSADLFVFPSLYEGFGLPPLEAMAAGCPVVSSNRSSLPEVVGDAGILVDPQNIEAMATAMDAVWNDTALAERLRNLGAERARLFTWERTARQTLEVYEMVGRSLVP